MKVLYKKYYECISNIGNQNLMRLSLSFLSLSILGTDNFCSNVLTVTSFVLNGIPAINKYDASEPKIQGLFMQHATCLSIKILGMLLEKLL